MLFCDIVISKKVVETIKCQWISWVESLGDVHLRCSACAEFTERIKTARGDERAAVMKAQEVHISMVRQFHCAQTRMSHMSEDAVKAGRQDNYDDFIKVDLDACDEAKFKCPRNTSNAKCLDGVWRPQLHLHGSLVWGVPKLTKFQ